MKGAEELNADIGVEICVAGGGVEVGFGAVDLAGCVSGAGEVGFAEGGRCVGCEGGGVGGRGSGSGDGGGLKKRSNSVKAVQVIG